MNRTPDIFLVPAAFSSIQAAVDAAKDPTTIIVYPGVYNESIIIEGKPEIAIQSARLTRRGVTVTGLDARGALAIERSTVHLSGIEIRSDGRCRGIWVSDSALSLQDCLIAGNRTPFKSPICHGASPDQNAGPGRSSAANEGGAGMYCLRSSVRLQKSAIIGNIVDCSTSGQLADARGGGLYFDECRIELAGCTVQANAIYCSGAARGGGIWCEDSRMRMWRSRVTDNALYAPLCEGGGIHFQDPQTVEIGGSVIAGNGFAQGRGGGIFIEGDRATVKVHRNTVVHQNHPDEAYSAMKASE